MTIEEAYRLYAPEMIRYASHHWCASDAEDIVHDIFAKMMTSYIEQGKVRGWLYTNLQNRIIDRARKLARMERPYPYTKEWRDRTVDPAIIAMARVEAQEVLDSSPITDKSRRTVILFYAYEIPFREVAEMVGVPYNAVKVQAIRGMYALRTGKIRPH